MAKKIKLGQKVADKITEFTGVVVGITEWTNGCRKIGVQSAELKDCKPIDIQWFDEDDMKVVKVKAEGKVKPRGGPRNNPSRARSGEQ